MHDDQPVPDSFDRGPVMSSWLNLKTLRHWAELSYYPLETYYGGLAWREDLATHRYRSSEDSAIVDA